MTTGLYLLLLFLQHGHCEEDLLTTENKTLSVSTSEESCELLAETCTYTLPMLEKERDYEQCQDEKVRENKVYFVANSVAVIIVGTSTNLLNLIAIPYVYFAYPGEFPWMSDRRALLLLHLSFCDLLYCTIGLPPFVTIFTNGFFYGSGTLCSFTAGLRNLIAYADIFTMAAIALATCFGFVCHNDCTLARVTNTPKATLISCLFIWLLAFIIISPAVFEFSIAQFGFGRFGWDSAIGICEVTSCSDPVGLASGAAIYLIGTTIPFLVLLLSHIALEVFFILRKSPTGSSQITAKNQTLPVLLSLAYAIFTGPLFPVELGMQIDVFWYLMCYSCYWWMYAVNIFIYIVSDQEFRKVYKLFLKDVFTCTRAASTATY